MTQNRVDTVANLTVEAGNFAAASKTPTDSMKTRALADFYRNMRYDAVGLSSREVAFGFDFWKTLSREKLPLLAANVFADRKGKKPLFEGWKSENVRSNGQFLIKEDHGERLGLISFVTATAWKARKDTSGNVSFRSPFEFRKLIQKVRKKCDDLVVTGEFTLAEADSFAKAFPEVDMIISSGIRTDQMVKQGNTAIVGSASRGNFANYLEWRAPTADTTAVFLNKSQVLDSSVPEDSTTLRIISQVNERIKTAATTPPPGTAPAKQ